LGALIGDAAGARLEFLGRRPTAEEIDEALRLPGGGVFGLAPGQVTDDGELTLSLADALVEAGGFDIEVIARCYAEWIESEPFDVGNTTRSSIGAAAFLEPGKARAAVMAEAAARYCGTSKANGALMRVSPLGVWGHGLEPSVLADLVRAECRLSHPHPNCQDASAAYAVAIAALVRRPGDREAAFEIAESVISVPQSEVESWLEEARGDEPIACYPLAGFVRIAFTLAFRALRLGLGYEEALRFALVGGGDTDTNACIVGGLLGAALGENGIPAAMREIANGCDTAGARCPRPARYWPGRGGELGEGLWRLGRLV
jgi:ADP-ribosylglycohydrolase